jgi:hypothetical protein
MEQQTISRQAADVAERVIASAGLTCAIADRVAI